MSSSSRPHQNTYWVLPGRLLAGEYHGAEDPDEAREKLDRFLTCGIGGFLDLTEDDEIAPYGSLLDERASRRGIEVAHRRCPLRDMGIPSTPEKMAAILHQIEDWLRAGRQVYVHCRGGVGRTGLVIGCYLVHAGRDGEEALQHLQRLWATVSERKRWCFPRSPQTADQENYIRTWPGAEARNGGRAR